MSEIFIKTHLQIEGVDLAIYSSGRHAGNQSHARAFEVYKIMETLGEGANMEVTKILGGADQKNLMTAVTTFFREEVLMKS